MDVDDGESGVADVLAMGYLGAVVVVLWAVLRWRRRVLSPPAPPPPPLGVDELAYLAGGASRLALATLVGLGERGEIGRGSRRRWLVARTHVPGPHATPAQASLLRAFPPGRQLRRREVRVLAERSPLAGVLDQHLRDLGLLVTGAQAWTARAGAVPLLGLLGVGVALLRFGLDRRSGQATGPFVIVPLLLLALVAATWHVLRVPRTTRLGREVLADARVRYAGLTLGNPSGHHARAVAIFGPAALWRADPHLAGTLGIPRSSHGSGGGDGGDGFGDGDGDGGGDGGGGD